MKNFILIIFILILTVSCGKKGDPVFKNSNKIQENKIIKI